MTVTVHVVLPAELVGLTAADLTASVAEPTPGPTPPTGDFEDFEVSPGLLGFLPPFLIALACVGLFLSLTRQLRKVNRRQAELDAAEAAAGTTGSGTTGAGTTGSGTTGAGSTGAGTTGAGTGAVGPDGPHGPDRPDDLRGPDDRSGRPGAP